MRKILLGILSAFTLLSCSTENESILNENSVELNQSQRNYLLESSSNIGIYKGVFTTNDSEFRGIAEIELISADEIFSLSSAQPTASIILNNGMVYKAKSNRVAQEGVAISNMEFTSENLSFNFSVDADGSNAVVENVRFKQTDAGILVAKHTNFAPVMPVTGTYVCTVCNGHPALNGTEDQTWNIIINEVTGDITSQVAFGGSILLNGIGIQENCTPNSNFTDCDINSGDGISNIGFTFNGQPITWTGTHNFNNQSGNPTGDCSGVSGTWDFVTNNYGTIQGTFISDFDCMDIIFAEDFQTFTGTGFSPTPIAGQLDSNIFRATGFSEGQFFYGEMKVTGDFARGPSTGGVSSGGVYAFDTDGTNISWGVQPAGSDWTPGTFEIRIQNTTGNTLSNFMVSYDIFVNNDQGRSGSFNFAYFTDTLPYTAVPSLDYTSPTNADNNGFVKISRSTRINVDVPAGGYIYLEFNGDDVSGSGSRDEFGLDNVVVRAN